MKEYIIKKLGGYTSNEIKAYKKTIYKHLKEMKIKEELSEDEKIIISEHRKEILCRQAKAKLNNDRRKQ